MALIYGVREFPAPADTAGIREELEFLFRERREKLLPYWPVPVSEARLQVPEVPEEYGRAVTLLMEERSRNYTMREAWANVCAEAAANRRRTHPTPKAVVVRDRRGSR